MSSHKLKFQLQKMEASKLTKSTKLSSYTYSFVEPADTCHMCSLPEWEKIDQVAATGFTKHVNLGGWEVSQTL